MENKQAPSKNKLISIKEEKLIREVEYGCVAAAGAAGAVGAAGNYTRTPKKSLLLDLEIFKKHPTQRPASQRVLVSIKPRAPAIKTLYIAEKSRFHGKDSEKSGSRSRLGIGDHSSFTPHLSDYDSNIAASTGCGTDQQDTKSSSRLEKVSTVSYQETSISQSVYSHVDRVNVYNISKRSAEKCYVYTQPQLTMNISRAKPQVDKSKVCPNTVDIGTYIANPSSDDSIPLSAVTLDKLHQKIDHLERKILRQEMVFRSIDPNTQLSSDEECKDNKMRAASGSGRPGCSYIEQYSHIPETSAFQRYAHQPSPLTPSKATTLEKEHNSEQYGRDFTAYDGITARGRRQCASVPCKHDDFPKMAAERVHKIRHKLNPVRDYRLMDTVHYLAQGEFAPRDDGIKLTPSREAVLSDIIWEDVCRTHWPNTRLGRRAAQPERCSTRCELQRLIDSLLRERVAHVERRRRRHYRIVKLNHRHESCRPVGKTGDIIVASHKNKETNDEREVHISDHNAASAMMSDRRWEEQSVRRSHRSHDRLMYQETRQDRRFREEDCSPGPSYAATRSPTNREATCCYHTSSPVKPERNAGEVKKHIDRNVVRECTGAGGSACRRLPNSPRLVVKKETAHRKPKQEEPDLEQYILLPTLVIRTPSNVRRQRKFNELYHRILNVQMNSADTCVVESDTKVRTPEQNVNRKDVGLNINITLSGSDKNMKKKPKPK